ncbi:ATP-binding protein [Arenibaculum pallidiluteum]|uniref:ATP-binding protein n=1 Tax=Arenibaculum pallidiluteum TaxID=2812559 RepID=UPI001A963E39|nr:ATP-binding protein [Arenibaculum pallidiluteum]
MGTRKKGRGRLAGQIDTERVDRRDRAFRPTSALIGLVCLVVLAFAGSFAYGITIARENAVDQAARQALNLARTLEQHTARMVSTVDLLLSSVSTRVRDLGPDPAATAMTAAARRILDGYGHRVFPVRNLLLADEAGWVLRDPAVDPRPRINVANRPYFKALRDDPGLTLHIGEAVPSLSRGTPMVPFVTGLRRTDGSFSGVAVAVVEPADLARFYASLDVGANGAIGLFRSDGALLAAWPESLSSQRLMSTVVTAGGDPEGAGTIDVDGHGRHLVVTRPVEGTPLVIAVTLAEEDILRSWRSDATNYAIALSLVAALAAMLTARLVQELRQREAVQNALSAAEQAYRSIFDNAIDGIYRCDGGGRLMRANHALVTLNGFLTEAEMLEEVPDLGRRWHVDPARRRRFHELLDAQGYVTDFVSEVQHPRTGERFWISENARAISDRLGRRLYYEGTVRDITQARQAEAQLREAKEQAELANRTKSEFLAHMSHELRTPLNAVIGFSEIIKDELFGPNHNPRYQEYARDIHDSGRHLLTLINEILDLAKVEAGGVELREETIEVEKVLESCRRLVRERAAAGQIVLNIGAEPGLPRLLVDVTRLKQILLNLLSNAVKFTTPGGEVRLEARRAQDGGVVLTVADTGIGMSEEQLDIAFQPFRQVENAFNRKYQGTGLGLPLSKALAELHGGSVTIESEPGKGTRVRVWLPSSRLVPAAA